MCADQCSYTVAYHLSLDLQLWNYSFKLARCWERYWRILKNLSFSFLYFCASTALKLLNSRKFEVFSLGMERGFPRLTWTVALLTTHAKSGEASGEVGFLQSLSCLLPPWVAAPIWPPPLQTYIDESLWQKLITVGGHMTPLSEPPPPLLASIFFRQLLKPC